MGKAAEAASTAPGGSRIETLDDRVDADVLVSVTVERAMKSFGRFLWLPTCDAGRRRRRRLSASLPPHSCHWLHPRSHCTSAGGSSVALCTHAVRHPSRSTSLSIQGSICVCARTRACIGESSASLSVTVEPYLPALIMADYSPLCV